MATRTAYAPVASEVLTAANMIRLPGGWIGYVEVTADQGPLSAPTDITGLTVTVTVGTSRRIRVSYLIGANAVAAGQTLITQIKEGAVILQSVPFSSSDTGGISVADRGAVVLTPSSGSHTYKLASSFATGSPTWTIKSAATNPSFLLVEDIGPA